VVAVWTDSISPATGKIKAAYSPDGGKNWTDSSPAELGVDVAPQVALDGLQAVAVWVDLVTIPGEIKAAYTGCVASLTATPGDGQVTLNWNQPTPVPEGYFVYISEDKDQPYEDWEFVECIDNPNTTTYTVTGLTNGTTYYFFVLACNSIDCNQPECSAFPLCIENPVVASATPFDPSSTPSNLTACKKAQRSPTQTDLIHALHWDALEGAIKYRVYIDVEANNLRKKDPGLLIAEIPSCKKPYVAVHGRCPGKKATYYVTAIDANGNKSAPASITV